MKLYQWILGIVGILLVVLAGCEDSYLRGDVAPSPDGKTYLTVVDDNGGACGPVLVDGDEWPHPIGERGEIEPGSHTIDCAGEIAFNVPDGVVFEFNYWGP